MCIRDSNSSSQEIVDYILNISSYETQIEVEVKSNKNSNKYKMKQTYIDNNNTTQEVIEPKMCIRDMYIQQIQQTM